MARHALISLTKLLAPQTSVLKTASQGYVMVLVAVFIPVILLGTKLVLDSRQESEHKVGKIFKKCAKECALEVAKHWNPGLSLKQQKESMLRIADEVYNASPAYNSATYKYNAIPGLEMPTKSVVTKQGMYKPLKVETSQTISLAPNSRVVEYETITDNWREYAIYGSNSTQHRTKRLHNPFYAIYKFERDPSYVTEDTLQSMVASTKDDVFDREWIRASQHDRFKAQFGWGNTGFPSTSYEPGTITKRKNAGDTKVQIWVENDKIKVKTDDDIGYAVPAECNVDIVLSIPVNGAASNQNNYDSNTLTAGSPLLEVLNKPSNNGKGTPIYQIARGFAKFIKDNFYHTRGTNIGIVPYCGQCSLDPDRMNAWTTYMPHFVATNFLANQNTYQAYLRPCNLYGMMRYDKTLPLSTSDQNVYDKDYGLTSHNLTNICARLGKYATDANAGNNIVSSGDILSVASPADSSGSTTKFGRICNYTLPGYGGKFNLLALKYEDASKAFWMTINPYFIIELQSDLLKITDLLNMFYPFPWYNNINMNSNFIFIPFTWANNLFQTWTNDPKFDAKNTTEDSTNLGRLKVQTKSTTNRKKAVILVVNKPDWFEPGELTYLGYDNDFSEVPMIESDCIRGDIDYSDTSQKFADGSSYDGTVYGAKKILKLTGFTRNSTTGYYECANGTGTLTFPKKYLVKVVVEPICVKVNSLNPPKQMKTLSYYNNQYIAVSTGPHCRIYTSTDGKAWTQGVDICGESSGADQSYILGYNSGQYIHCTKDGCIRVGSSLSSWQNKGNLVSTHVESGTEFENKYMIADFENGTINYTTDGGNSWTSMGTKLSALCAKGYVETISSNNGILVAITGKGWVSRSLDGGETWSEPVQALSSMNSSGIYQCRTGNGKFIALECNFKVSESYDGVTWSTPIKEIPNTEARCVAYGHAGWVYITYEGDVYHKSGTIQFTNLKTVSNRCTEQNKVYTVTDKQEFFIEADQINGGSDGAYTITFNAQNLRLISAEITNRPYVKVTPTVTQSENVFTLSAKVPFVITMNRAGKITYTTASGTKVETDVTKGGWGYMQVTPESHQYVKTYDSNNPVYKVTLTHSKGSSAIVSATIGIAEEHTETKSGLNIEHEAAGTKSKVSMGSCLSYQKTDKNDTTGSVTIDTANKRIYCPVGTILHVKATPTGTTPLGGVTFYDTNGVEDNVGTHMLTEATTFTFSGGQDPSGHYEDVSSTRGPNFGHNLCVKKVRYDTCNANITAATLTNQYVRDYNGVYNRKNKGYKQLILNTEDLAIISSNRDYSYDPFSTYGVPQGTYTSGDVFTYIKRFRDSCVDLTNLAKICIHAHGTEYLHLLGSDDNYRFDVYGLSDSCQVFMLGSGSRAWCSLYTSGEGWSCENARWTVCKGSVSGSPKEIVMMRSKVSDGSYSYYHQTYFKNGAYKTLQSTTQITENPINYTGLKENKGTYLAKYNGENWICFQGDGELKVTVTPKTVPYGTIKFKCANESDMTHEVYKEFNFCIEPSQMKSNDDSDNPKQYVAYEANNCSISAYCEYQNYSTIKLTKTDDVPSVRWSTVGHKKEMVWKAANPQPKSSSDWCNHNNKHVEYDGTNCYIAGRTKIFKSTDLGKSWYVAASIPSSIQNTDATNFALARGFWYLVNINGDIHMSADSGSTWINIPGLKNLGWGGYFRAAFTYAKGLYMAEECMGKIAQSSDGINWSQIGSARSVNDSSHWDYGIEYVNGSWYSTTAWYNYSSIMLAKIDDKGSCSKQMSDSISSSLSELYTKYPVFAAGGSNQMIIGGTNRKVYTSTDFFASTCYDHGDMFNSIGISNLRSVGYANGVFIACNDVGQIAYTTYHDGVEGIKKSYICSKEASESRTWSYIAGGEDLYISNFVITSISGTYAKIVKTFPTTIEFKKIRVPDQARYIDYSNSVLNRYLASAKNEYTNHSNGWTYDTSSGFYVNKSSNGYHAYIMSDSPKTLGDHTILTYSDSSYLIRNFAKDGWNDGGSSRKTRDFLTSGLGRTYTTVSNFNNDALKDAFGNIDVQATPKSISMIMQTLTLPINAMLYAGYYGNAYHDGAWYKDQSGNATYDASEAVKNVTKAACKKLQEDWKPNIRIYLIKFRKQTQYKNKIANATTDFDYSYLNDCASDTGSTTKIATTQEDAGKFRFDISSEADLNTALSAIATNIKSWAGYKPAENK